MRILLIEDQDILRQAIGMAVKEIFGDGDITAHSGYTAFDKSDVNPLEYEVALLDPGAPPVTLDDQAGRLKAVADVSSKLNPDCMIAVMTGEYRQPEAQAMLEMGVAKYMSKVGLGILELRSALNDPQISVVGPAITGTSVETFHSGLSRSEMLGHAVDQGIYQLDELSEALEVDVETVRKYVTRARSRLRSSPVSQRKRF